MGKRGIIVFNIIWLLKNGMECDGIKGLILRQNTKNPPHILLKIDIKVWNGVDPPPRPVMENSILFYFIFETFPNKECPALD